jgi:ribosomal protein S18 acetylase RimI-like enzyme
MLKFREQQSDYRLCFTGRKGQELYLGMLTVSPELQNSGLGKIIATGRSSCTGIGPAKLMTVISQGRTIAWYKRHGYINGEKNLSSKRYSYFNRKTAFGIYRAREK